MKTTDTALLGHVSARALSAAALSDLWTMCTGVYYFELDVPLLTE